MTEQETTRSWMDTVVAKLRAIALETKQEAGRKEAQTERLNKERDDCIANLIRGGIFKGVERWEVDVASDRDSVIFRAAKIPPEVRALPFEDWTPIIVSTGVTSGSQGQNGCDGVIVLVDTHKRAVEVVVQLGLKNITLNEYVEAELDSRLRDVENNIALMESFGQGTFGAQLGVVRERCARIAKGG